MNKNVRGHWVCLSFFIILSLILAFAASAHAGQRAITVGSLTSAYKSKIGGIDTRLEVLNTSKKGKKQVITLADSLKVRVEIQHLEEEKHITEVAYQLMLDALK